MVTQHKFTHQSQSNRENDPKSQYCTNTPNQHSSEGQQQTPRRGEHAGERVDDGSGQRKQRIESQAGNKGINRRCAAWRERNGPQGQVSMLEEDVVSGRTTPNSKPQPDGWSTKAAHRVTGREQRHREEMGVTRG